MTSSRTSEPFKRWFSGHPARAVAFSFAVFLAVGTLLLMLPIAREADGGAPVLTALFTATGASCGALSVVDTATYWTGIGQVIILGLIQLGGLGVMTIAALLGLLVSRRLGLRSRLTAAEETHTVGIGDLREVLTGVIKVTLTIEGVVAVLLWLRFWLGYDEGVARAAWLGLFHSVSAFNNAGYALFSDNMAGFVDDPWVMLPMTAGCALGALGFPVFFELIRRTPYRRWSLHTRMTVWGSLVLILAGWLLLTFIEWDNPDTLGALEPGGRVLAGLFQSVAPRTAGFNSVDYGQMHEESLLVTDILMFIGGGSASTAGGIKVTTFFLLFFVILAEIRGDAEVTIGDRKIDRRAQRQALTVALLAVAVVIVPTLVLMQISKFSFSQVLFEVISAFATAGGSTGITGDLPGFGQLILVGLMFLGRIGPMSLASALAIRDRQRLYEYPEGRPLIG